MRTCNKRRGSCNTAHVLQHALVTYTKRQHQHTQHCCSVLQYAAVCCSVLQCVAVRCSALQCVARRGSIKTRSTTRVPATRAQLHLRGCNWTATRLQLDCFSAHVFKFQVDRPSQCNRSPSRLPVQARSIKVEPDKQRSPSRQCQWVVSRINFMGYDSSGM